MKIFLQLLKEFWLPLLLGVAWTLFNVIDRPPSSWKIKEIVNIFGPTFFFISWLVAQWYRVKKQQKIENDLTGIQDGLHAIQSPILPCSLFYTLKFSCKDEDLKHVFGKHKGYRAYGELGNQGDSPPLPPEITNARVFSPKGNVSYVDYQDGYVKAAGVIRKKYCGYNLIHSDIKHTICSLARNEIDQTESLLLRPALVKIEFFFDGKPTIPTATPSLTLITSPRSVTEVVAVEVLDNMLFEDIINRELDIESPKEATWSTKNLKNSYLKITLDFFFISGVYDISKENEPTLHNFQLWFGNNANRVLTFSPEQLACQSTQDNPNPVATGQAKFIQILFEHKINENIYTKQLLSSS